MPSVFDKLEQEWARLAPRFPGQDLEAICAVVGATTLGELHAWVRSADRSEADRVMAPLAERAAAGSESAARVLLQLLLPGTCRLAASWWALGDAEERASAAVTAVYQRIRNYPIDRRPTKVAANILLDAGQDLWRAAKKLNAERTRVVCVDPGAVMAPRRHVEPHPADELAEAIHDAVAAGHIAAGDAELIVATRIEGRRLADLAIERGAKLRTLQWRRQVAEAVLARTGSAA